MWFGELFWLYYTVLFFDIAVRQWNVFFETRFRAEDS
jgi:hypothetical protein